MIFAFGAVLGIALANEQNYAAETDRQNASGQSAAAPSGANAAAESSTYRPHPYTPADKFAVAAKPENWPQLLGSGLTFVTLVVLLFTLREVAAQARATERAVNVANLTQTSQPPAPSGSNQAATNPQHSQTASSSRTVVQASVKPQVTALVGQQTPTVQIDVNQQQDKGADKSSTDWVLDVDHGGSLRGKVVAQVRIRL